MGFVWNLVLFPAVKNFESLLRIDKVITMSSVYCFFGTRRISASPFPVSPSVDMYGVLSFCSAEHDNKCSTERILCSNASNFFDVVAALMSSTLTDGVLVKSSATKRGSDLHNFRSSMTVNSFNKSSAVSLILFSWCRRGRHGRSTLTPPSRPACSMAFNRLSLASNSSSSL